MLQIVSEPGWCYVVTLSATGGPATAVLPPPPQQQHPGLASQSPAEGPGAALPGSMVSAATWEPSHSSSAGPDGQSSVGLAGSSASNAAPSEQFSSAAGSTIRDEHPDSEQPLHSTLAGMSLGGASPQSQPAHAQASEPAQADTELHGQSTEASFDDPLRRGQRPDAQRDVLQGQEGNAVHHARAAENAVDLPLFTGFVSHEQLETAIGSTSYERRLASSKELTHWVKMRGPGIFSPILLSGAACMHRVRHGTAMDRSPPRNTPAGIKSLSEFMQSSACVSLLILKFASESLLCQHLPTMYASVQHCSDGL